MQRFISNVEENDSEINDNYCNTANNDMGHRDRVIIFNDSGLPKKRNNFIGVYKQYYSSLDKIHNCKVGVFASYTSQKDYSLINKRLYIHKN